MPCEIGHDQTIMPIDVPKLPKVDRLFWLLCDDRVILARMSTKPEMYCHYCEEKFIPVQSPAVICCPKCGLAFPRSKEKQPKVVADETINASIADDTHF